MAEQSAQPANYVLTTKDLFKSAAWFAVVLCGGVWAIMVWVMNDHASGLHAGAASQKTLESLSQKSERLELDVRDVMTKQAGTDADMTAIKSSLIRIERKLDQR